MRDGVTFPAKWHKVRNSPEEVLDKSGEINVFRVTLVRNRIALSNDNNNVAFDDLEYHVSTVFQSSGSAK